MLGRLNRARERGLSLVELMVALALGLFIVAMAATVLVHRLREYRSTLAEGRLMQDLRAGADLVVRDLRRAGYWGHAASAVASPAASRGANPYDALAPAASASDAASFRFSRDASENDSVDSNEQFGVRLRRGVLEMQLGGAGWQAVTDSGTMVVTALRITPVTQDIDLQAICDRPCPADAPACGPTQRLRSLVVSMSARAVEDPRVVRSVRSAVHVRNDAVSGTCPV